MKKLFVYSLFLVVIMILSGCAEEEVLDCGDDMDCFTEAVKNCTKAKAQSEEDDVIMSLEVVDIKKDTCNVVVSIKMGEEMRREIIEEATEEITKMSDSDYEDLIEMAGEEYEIELPGSKEEFIDSLSEGMKMKFTKEGFLSGREPISIEGGALFLVYLGVLRPVKFLPSKCMLPAGIACTNFKIDSSGGNNGQVQITLRNGMGYDIGQINVKIPECSATGVSKSDAGLDCSKATSELNNGDQCSWTINCDGGSALTTGERFSSDLTIEYTNVDSGLTHRVTGTITGKVQ